MSFATANGSPIQTMTLTLPPVGAWRAKLRTTAEAAPAEGDQVVIEAAGSRFVGRARRPGADPGGQVSVLVIGGTDGLATDVSANSYRDITVREGLSGILDLVGERLSARSDESILGTGLSFWSRPAGTAADALTALLADSGAGGTWRVLDDGTVWLGFDAGDTVEPDHRIVDDKPEEGFLIVGVETLELRPGQTFLAGPVAAVVYELDDALRATVRRTAGGGGAARGLARSAQRELAAAGVPFHPLYRARVAAQNEDGTLELVVVGSDKVAAPPRVGLRHGLPGVTTLKLAAGAEVVLGFEGGDRRRPFAALPLKGGRLLHLVVDGDRFEWGGTEAVALASKVDDRFAALENRVLALEAWGPGVTPPFPGGPGAGGSSTAAEKLFTE